MTCTSKGQVYFQAKYLKASSWNQGTSEVHGETQDPLVNRHQAAEQAGTLRSQNPPTTTSSTNSKANSTQGHNPSCSLCEHDQLLPHKVGAQQTEGNLKLS